MNGAPEYSSRELKRLLATDSRFKVAGFLLAGGHISMSQLVESISWVRQGLGLSATYFLKKGYIEENTIPNVLVRNYNYKRFIPGTTRVEAAAVSLLPYHAAKTFRSLAFRVYRGCLILAMVEPANEEIQKKICRLTSLPVKAMVISERDIADAFQEYYSISEFEYRSFLRPLPNEQQAEANDWADLDSVNMSELISGALEDYVSAKSNRRKKNEGMARSLKRLLFR